MFTKRSHKSQLQVASLVLALSLILSLTPGFTTGTALAEASGGSVIQGEPGTPMQTRLYEAINQKIAEGLPVPDVTFSTQSSSTTESFGALSATQTLTPPDQTTTTTATTTLFFDGPQEAGYDTWPAVEISGNLAGEDNSFATGDLTEIIRSGMALQDPEFWNQVNFGKEAREFTITETIEQSPGSGPPLQEMSSLGSFQTATLDNLLTGDPLATTQEDILMGFTYTGPHIKYVIEQDAKACIWIPFVGTRCKEMFYIKAGFELDWALGLRLPANVTLSEMEDTTGTHFETSLIRKDWDASEYSQDGVADEEGNEFVLRLDFFAGVLVRVVGEEVCPYPLPVCYVDLSQNYSKSFETPFGTGTTFPLPDLTLQMFVIEPLGGIITASVDLIIQPRIFSTKIMADWDRISWQRLLRNRRSHIHGIRYTGNVQTE